MSKHEIVEAVAVEKADLLAWRQEWLDANGDVAEDGTDIVTPFDQYLYGAEQYLKGKVEIVSHGRCATVTKIFPNLWCKVDASCSMGLRAVLHRADGKGALARCRKWAEEHGYELPSKGEAQ